MDSILAVDLPDSPVDPGSITDWQSWPPQVWGVIAGLLILMTAVFFWKSMSGKAQLLIDCSGVLYVSSAGLRVLLTGAKKTKAAGGSLSCCALQPMVRQVFELSGFGSFLPVYADRTAALEALA